ncbi:MAG: aminodeoxychorismate synthase component I [Ahniella sp.]|nr:aminodeoxychorismate synthase component I [Ahniella sp.]
MLTRALPAGLDLVALHAAFPDRFPVLLESRARHARSGRYDLLLAGNGHRLVQVSPNQVRDEHDQTVGEHLLDLVDQNLSGLELQPGPGHFAGGYALLLSYEFAACLEPKLASTLPRDTSPLAIALRTPLALVRDHEDNSVTAVFEPAAAPWAEAVLGQLRVEPLPAIAPLSLSQWQEDDPAGFIAGVERIREYVAAGDVFQVNLSRRWHGHMAPGTLPIDLYRRLREANPAPFAGSFRFGDLAVLSSSPERLVSVRGDQVETRPIAGTRPRGIGEHDDRLQAELMSHPKERAEHVMLIDLERNDLGRVSVPGSVEVDELMGMESYTHVHHIVSNVRGRLRPDASVRDIVAAVFPGGTITGCPKIRCMQIIAELEQAPRGFYTGAMGFIGPGRQMELNILIRTMTLRGQSLSLRAGAGIVFDSVPARELDETRHKARGLLRALERDA